jgi:hypothetical protein
MRLTYSKTLQVTLRPDVLVCGAGVARRGASVCGAAPAGGPSPVPDGATASSW